MKARAAPPKYVVINERKIPFYDSNYDPNQPNELTEGDVRDLLTQISLNPPYQIFESQTSIDAKSFAEVLKKAQHTYDYKPVINIDSPPSIPFTREEIDQRINEEIRHDESSQLQLRRFATACSSLSFFIFFVTIMILFSLSLGNDSQELYTPASSSYCIAQLINQNFRSAVDVLDNVYGMKRLHLAVDDDQNDLYKVLLWGKIYLKDFPSRFNYCLITDIPIIHAILTGKTETSIEDAKKIVSYFPADPVDKTLFIILVSLLCIFIVALTTLILLISW